MLDYNKILKKIKPIILEVGEIQKENFGRKNLMIDTKSTEIDFVTEIDKLSEKKLIEFINKNYPDHNILAEESGNQELESDYLWVIDPLDGTTNYSLGLPIFAISVALKYKDKAVLGIVYTPMTNQFFYAIKGEGAYLNNEKLVVSKKQSLNRCVLATGFPYDRASNPDNNANYFNNFVPKVMGLRRMGAAAYDLANVAAGRLDGYWEMNLGPWDVAAGILLVEEAGGKIIYLDKKNRGISLVAGSNKIADIIFSELEEVGL